MGLVAAAGLESEIAATCVVPASTLKTSTVFGRIGMSVIAASTVASPNLMKTTSAPEVTIRTELPWRTVTATRPDDCPTASETVALLELKG